MQLGKFEIKRNLKSNLIYLVVNAVCLFVVYKLIIDRLGKDALGTWSVLFSFLVVIINSGSATNTDLTRKYLENYDRLDRYFIGNLLLNSFALYVTYFLFYVLIIFSAFHFFIPNILYENLTAVLVMLAGIFFGMLNFAFSAILDASKLNYIKNRLSTISVLFFLAASFFLISRKLGILGISIAYGMQFLTLFVLLLFSIFKRFNPSIKLSYLSLAKMKNLIKSGWKLQIISLLTISYDPITKYFLLQTSTLSFIARFEIVSRLSNQVRSLLISSNQTLLPNLLGLDFNGGDNSFFKKIFNHNFKLTLLFFSFLLISIPLFEWVLFGEATFLMFSMALILVPGILFNILSVPFYFYFIVNNKLEKPLWSHITIVLINIILPFILLGVNDLFHFSPNYNGLFVISFWSFALIAGSIVLTNNYMNIAIGILKEDRGAYRYFLYYLTCCLCLGFSIFISDNSLLILGVMSVVSLFIIWREKYILLSLNKN